MNTEYKFHVFGQASILNRWKIKYRANINKLYYVHNGTAVYEYKNKTHHMMPRYIYLFPASVDVKFSLMPDVVFEHTFFDFFSNPILKTNSVIKIKAEDFNILEKTLNVISDVLKVNRSGKSNYFCFCNDKTQSEIYQIIYHCFCVLMILINSITPVYTSSDSRIFDTLNYINTHYNQKITVKELAESVFLEQNYFIKLFKKHVGKSPHQYIKDYRIDMALNMLEQGKSISETAFECGYLSVSAFSYAVKNKLGVSPSEII